VPSGGILVDGMALGEMQNSLLKERQEISEEGIVIISLALDSEFRPVARPYRERRVSPHG
jgi:ribonuclease J